jgi:6-pyruvoyltetrahydropterin/6-carboxytetrahydropterin synthase
LKYRSTKTYESLGPVAYRQWRADSHCNLIHGYALSFHFEFESDTLDVRNWCMDFGGLRPLKEKLEEWFDHTLLVAEDDPHFDELMKLQELGLAKCTVVEKTGCEGLATFLYEYVNTIFLPSYGEHDRVWCTKVEVRETEKNMAMVVGERGDVT